MTVGKDNNTHHVGEMELIEHDDNSQELEKNLIIAVQKLFNSFPPPDNPDMTSKFGGWFYAALVYIDKKKDLESRIGQLVDTCNELVVERDLWKSRYEHHKNERLEALNLNAMQASRIASGMKEKE